MKLIASIVSVSACAVPLVLAAPRERQQNSPIGVGYISEFRNYGEVSQFLQYYVADMDCDEACGAQVSLADSDPVAAFKESWTAMDAYIEMVSEGIFEQPGSEFNTSMQTASKLLAQAPAESEINMDDIADMQCPTDPGTADICHKLKEYYAEMIDQDSPDADSLDASNSEATIKPRFYVRFDNALECYVFVVAEGIIAFTPAFGVFILSVMLSSL